MGNLKSYKHTVKHTITTNYPRYALHVTNTAPRAVHTDLQFTCARANMRRTEKHVLDSVLKESGDRLSTKFVDLVMVPVPTVSTLPRLRCRLQFPFIYFKSPIFVKFRSKGFECCVTASRDKKQL